MAARHYITVTVFLVVFAFITVKAQKLTATGAFAAIAVGFVVFLGGGYDGLGMLSAFFILGTLATSWKKKDKLVYKADSDRSVRRDAGQVLANGSVAAISGLMAFLMHDRADTFQLLMAAALSSAMADTLSSELGVIYGRRFFNIISFRREAKGLDGVISLEGTLIGIAGSAIIAMIATGGHIQSPVFIWVIIAGTLGNFADSVLGALFERKKYISNNGVNFLNTLIAAIIMFAALTLLLPYQP